VPLKCVNTVVWLPRLPNDNPLCHLPYLGVVSVADTSPYRFIMLVVLVPTPDSGAPPQGVLCRLQGLVEDTVSEDAKGDWEVKDPMEDPGPLGG